MEMRSLGQSGLRIAPLVFGGNVFGWSADEATSFALLDAFVDGGFNAIDTADIYSTWLPGHKGGESEEIIGNWLAARHGMRERVVIMTKVGLEMGPGGKGGGKGLSAKWIEQAAEDSLRRLKTDVIDLYQSHRPDASTPEEETLTAYDRLIKAGKVQAIGASNYDAGLMRNALDIAGAKGLPRYEVLQPEYNLYDRAEFDGPLRDFCMGEGVGVIPYYSLASGFLTGKYRSEADFVKSPARGAAMAKYMNPRGMRILDALDIIAGRHQAQPAEIALAWLMARPGVTAPIASATSLAQLDSLMKAARIALPAEDIAELDTASQ